MSNLANQQTQLDSVRTNHPDLYEQAHNDYKKFASVLTANMFFVDSGDFPRYIYEIQDGEQELYEQFLLLYTRHEPLFRDVEL